MNKIISILHQWSTHNRRTINPHKTKAIPFNYRNFVGPTNLNIQINQTRIDIVDKYVYLGVTLDQNLSFIPHINGLISRCSQKLFMLSTIRKFLTDHIALKLNKSLILSIIDYGDILYDGANKRELDKNELVQKLQNRALRIISLCQRYTTNLFLHRY